MSSSSDEMLSSDNSDSDLDTVEDSGSTSRVQLTDDDFRQMPFEELLQLKRRLGSKVYNEAVFGNTHKDDKNTVSQSVKVTKRETRVSNEESDSDGPPEELTAKRKVPAFGITKNRREAAQSRSKDPRFDSKHGYFSGRQFREQYGFINDLRTTELQKLKKQLKETEDPEEIDQIKFAIRRTENQIHEFNKQKTQDKKRQDEKLQTRQAIDEGKRPFYEKNSTKKARELVEKYDKLKEEGKIGKHIDKRKRKITAKDRKKLDFST